MKKIYSVLAALAAVLLVTSCEDNAVVPEWDSTDISTTSSFTETTPEPALTEAEDSTTDIVARTYDFPYEIVDITSFDGFTFKGRLSMPEGEDSVPKLVIHINGSGPNTYINNCQVTSSHEHRRTRYNYFDFYADEFSRRGIAFFSYNTRGVTILSSTNYGINSAEYQTYLPLNSVEDVYHMITTLCENPRLQNAKVYLLGFSEGSVVAPLVAEKYPELVDALILEGCVSDGMDDIFLWQVTGKSTMDMLRKYGEPDSEGRISRTAYEAIPDIAKDLPFETIDTDKDGYIDDEDLKTLFEKAQGYSADDLFSAIERRDDAWLKAKLSRSPLTSLWFLEHFSLRTNLEVLPTLDLPIYIFHGADDVKTNVEGVYKIGEKFQQLGKTNLTVHVFEEHDHMLNYEDIVVKNVVPEGIQAMLDTVERMEIWHSALCLGGENGICNILETCFVCFKRHRVRNLTK